jgi:hypothetical protein
MTDDEFATETGSKPRSLFDRFTATERFPVAHNTARRDYRGVEVTLAVEIGYADLPPDGPQIKRRSIVCVAETDDQIVARETSTMTIGEPPRWFGLFGGDYRHVPSTSAHALTVIEPVREAVDECLDMEEDPELAAALAVEIGELSGHER